MISIFDGNKMICGRFKGPSLKNFPPPPPPPPSPGQTCEVGHSDLLPATKFGPLIDFSNYQYKLFFNSGGKRREVNLVPLLEIYIRPIKRKVLLPGVLTSI
jgi:hypothetical protein